MTTADIKMLVIIVYFCLIMFAALYYKSQSCKISNLFQARTQSYKPPETALTFHIQDTCQSFLPFGSDVDLRESNLEAAVCELVLELCSS